MMMAVMEREQADHPPILDQAVQPIRHLYLHIPFCRHKCGYCDFNAYAGMDSLQPSYVKALLRELEQARQRLPFAGLKTVYLGGGTPSLIPPSLISHLLRELKLGFELEEGVEVTLEANPASTDVERLTAWREGGVNRLSLGVQSFDLPTLAVLERKSDGVQAELAYREARSVGFENISLDLIYGVPGQSLIAWQESVSRAVQLKPEHLSCYCLSFEAGTLLYRRLQEGRLRQRSEDEQWELLEAANQILARSGYCRYEVSSWALPGKRSRHNQAYWACRSVYGAGAGAHSYLRQGELGQRWWNLRPIREYIAQTPEVWEGGEELAARLAAAERIMLGLRCVRGLRPPAGFEAELAQLAARGLITRSGGWVSPTRRGLDLHNQIALAVL
ncbi:MAG: radical SAM family heme chaperone HemW [Candidatus Dormibacteraceae bacterium]